MFAVHGTADEPIAYDGGPSTKGIAGVQGPSAPALNAQWRATDDCAAPTTTRATDVVMDTGGTPLADDTYRGWETTDALWAFFAAHPKA